MKQTKGIIFTVFIFIFVTLASAQSTPTQKHGRIVTEHLTSTVLRENKINLDLNRSIKVFLPPGYDNSKKPYPVVYYLHNIFWSAEKMFEDGNVVELIERAFANSVVPEFIFVAADYTTSTTGSLYENSPVSGRWLDYTVQEIVPFIDSHFRTLASRDSRAIAGDFMGGRGALKMAMVHSEVFSVVYALHPVATGIGRMPWVTIDIDWKKMYTAKMSDDLTGAGITQLFLTVCQAFLPNLNSPPFYCDFFMDMENGVAKVNPGKIQQAKEGFHLEESLLTAAPYLRSMRGVAFDWGRFDPTDAHVISNQAFSRRLEDLGVIHEAEEYCGNPWNKNWIENGRFYARMLPFFAQHLVFEK